MLSSALRFLIRIYRLVISPALHLASGPGQGCRFEPSCSDYSDQAIRIYGPYRGGWLALKRICRCHPFSRSGFDPGSCYTRHHFKPSLKGS